MGAVSRFSILDSNNLRLAASGQRFDILVIGGGITGAGVARDAALRGMKVLLLERGDVAQGTSSRSSRLIHGGLRYLEKGRLGLVHESVSERWRMMRAAPHLARPLPFIFPTFRGEHPGLTTLRAGTFAYSLLSAFRTPGPRSTLSPAAVQERAPGLRRTGLTGAARYFDCSTDDARLTLEVAIDAVEAGAIVLPGQLVTDLGRDGDGVSAEVRCSATGQTWHAAARMGVLALGPWTDTLLSKASPAAPRWLRPTKGIHLVFHSRRLPISDAVVMRTPGDHRITFAIPWGTHTYVGTTDTDFPDPGIEPRVEAADAAYMLDTVNHYFPDLRVTPADIVSAWAGLRPLVAPEDEVAPGSPVNPSDVTREEKIELFGDRFLAVAGGKLTTWRQMAEDVTSRAARVLERKHGFRFRPCCTVDRALPGGALSCTPPSEQGPTPGSPPGPLAGSGQPAQLEVLARLAASQPDLPDDWVTASVQRLGTRAARLFELARDNRTLLEPLPGADPLRLADVHFAITQEHAASVEDFLVRRTQVFYKAEDQGRAAAPVVAEVLAGLGAVSADRTATLLADYLAELDSWKGRLGC
jgi:glycerol-3-phosphate dehydrogenase